MKLKITCNGLYYNSKQKHATVLRKYLPHIDRRAKESGYVVFIPGINDEHNKIPFNYTVWRIT